MTAASKDHRPQSHLNYSWKEAALPHAPHQTRAASWGHRQGGRDTIMEPTGTRVVAQGKVRENHSLRQEGRSLSLFSKASAGNREVVTEAAGSGGLEQVIFPILFSVIAENSSHLRGCMRGK